MERLRKHEDEQIFFAKELRARRDLYSRYGGRWLINLLYEYASGYGLSVLRPTCWIAGVFLLGLLFLSTFPVINGHRMTIDRAAGLSFANLLSFLPFKREIMTDEIFRGLSASAKVLEIIQSISGVILLFLLALALRNRFRMK
jgi:hypothetical protein